MTKEQFTNRVLPSKEKLFRIALSLLGNREEAEDTLQDAFLKLWEMRDRLSEYSSIEALAVTMTKNLCLDKLRSYRHRNRDSGNPAERKLQSVIPDPHRTAELEESMKVIHDLLTELPDRQRLIFHLRDVELYSYEEISELTGLTVNNIRVNVSRARKKVRKEYLNKQNYGRRKS